MKDPLLTDEARNDLAEIWATIAKARDERTADRMNQRILAACRVKAEFPETGQSWADLAPDLRSLVVKPYVVFFRAEADTILVLRILHGRRDVRTIMGEV